MTPGRAGASGSTTVLLSPRKAQILELLVVGLSNKEIARQIGISTRTAEKHLEQLRDELGFHNRQQLALWAISRGLVPLPVNPPAIDQPRR
jgi:DNA-binding NarL/FixJ family response regulator